MFTIRIFWWSMAVSGVVLGMFLLAVAGIGGGGGGHAPSLIAGEQVGPRVTPTVWCTSTGDCPYSAVCIDNSCQPDVDPFPRCYCNKDCVAGR